MEIGRAVKHPSHYVEGRKFEPKDVIRDWGLNFNLGSAVKYVARAGRKDDIVQDLKKAQEFIQFEIDAIEAERAKAVKPTDPQHSSDTRKTQPKVRVIKLVAPKGVFRESGIRKILDDIYGEK